MHGSGRTEFDGMDIPWKTGDFVVLPIGKETHHFAATDSAFTWFMMSHSCDTSALKLTSTLQTDTLYIEDSLRELDKVRKKRML